MTTPFKVHHHQHHHQLLPFGFHLRQLAWIEKKKEKKSAKCFRQKSIDTIFDFHWRYYIDPIVDCVSLVSIITISCCIIILQLTLSSSASFIQTS